jgi:hypothetical protein
MTKRPSRWFAAALGVALGVVVAAPVALLRTALRPVPLDSRNLRVQFESVRYERAGLVFTYRIANRTGRSASLLPAQTKLRARQQAGPAVGYPVMQFPLRIQAHESRRVEVRLELVLPREPLTPRESADQTARVLQHQLPGTAMLDSHVSPLPMTALPAAPEPPATAHAITPPDVLLARALTALEGFDLVDEHDAIHIVFPRGW